MRLNVFSFFKKYFQWYHFPKLDRAIPSPNFKWFCTLPFFLFEGVEKEWGVLQPYGGLFGELNPVFEIFRLFVKIG